MSATISVMIGRIIMVKGAGFFAGLKGGKKNPLLYRPPGGAGNLRRLRGHGPSGGGCPR
jgi:hypothetical protein